MAIPTEPIGSLPRPAELIEALAGHAAGNVSDDTLEELFDQAVGDTITRMAATGSPILCDGEQTKPSFVGYPLAGMANLGPDGAVIPFADGHTRQLPVLTGGPFAYQTFAGSYLPRARKFTDAPLKQAVIAPSAMSLLYPQAGLGGYSAEQFHDDLVTDAVRDIRSCLDHGADSVQLDFTEGRLALKLDPSGGVLRSFIELNNEVLGRFTDDERQKIGVHTCPGGDHDSTHSADIDYRELLPQLLQLDVGRFYLQMASEQDPGPSLAMVGEHLQPHQTAYVGVIDVIDEEVESVETVRDRVLAAAEHIPVTQLGTTDDCGFSPFSDDVATSRDTAFAKITARVEGTRLAAQRLGV